MSLAATTNELGTNRFVNDFKKVCGALIWIVHCIYQAINSVVVGLLAEMHAMELLFIKMNHIYALVCQMLFFTMCEMVLFRPFAPDAKDEKKIMIGLSTLLFYSIFAYFVSRIRDAWTKDWSRSVRHQYTTTDYIKWMLRIILEWAKAIIIVFCLKDQGMTFSFEFYYSLITFTYYISTERIFIDLLTKSIKYFEWELLESFEHLYVPFTLILYSIFISAIATFYCLKTENGTYAVFATYFTIYLRMKDLIYNYLNVIQLERSTFASFRQATEKDIQEWDDICAVCLNRMSRARITPCNHLFHPQCLKQCLQNSLHCPLCKRGFVE